MVMISENEKGMRSDYGRIPFLLEARDAADWSSTDGPAGSADATNSADRERNLVVD